MYLTWHILRKDFTRLRLPLVVWSALQLIALVGPDVTWSLTSLTPEQIRFSIYLFASVQALAWLAAFDFAIRLIHEDSPMRADAFWRTRPVSGLRLLTAKLGGLLLFTLLSATPSLVTAAFCSSISAAAALLELTLKTHLIIAACAVPFATLTRSFRQCLLVSLGLILAAVTAFAGVHLIYDPAGSDLYASRTTLMCWVALLTAGAVVLHQFTQGRLPRSLLIAGTGTLVVIATATLWPWRFPLSISALPSASDEPAETRSLSLTYDKSHVWNEAEFWAPSLRPVLNMDFAVSGFPSGYFLGRNVIHHHWLTDSSPSVRGAGGWLFPHPDARILLGLIPPGPPPKSVNVQSQIPEEFAVLLRSGRKLPHYYVDLVFDLYRAEVTEIPLQPAQTVSTPHTDIRLLTIDPDRARIRLVERISEFPTLSLRSYIQDQFILYNPRTGAALRSSGSESVSFTSLMQHDLSFAPIESANVTSRAIPLTDDFLRDARLVKISFPRTGTFARTVEIPALEPRISR